MTDETPSPLPDPEPTAEMPSMAAAPVPGAPSTDPMATDPMATDPMATDPDADATKPWYKQKKWLITMGVVLAAIVGLVLYLLLKSDDESRPTNSVVIERVDEAGEPIETELVGQVIGLEGEEDEFLWLEPAGGRGPETAETVTSSNTGIAAFRWEPTPDVESREDWTSTIRITEEIPAGSGLSAAAFECTLERFDVADSTILLAVELEVPGDETSPTIATYSFPNMVFEWGDSVRCEVVNGPPATTTTTTSTTTSTTTTSTSTTTTTTSTTTTTTTVAPTTTEATTTVPATTAPPEPTTPPESTSTTIPQETNTALDVIDSRPDLSRARELIEVAGLSDVLADPAATLTLFMPNNDAIAALEAQPDAPDLTDPAIVTALLQAHASVAEVLTAEAVLALDAVELIGGPQPVDAAATPPTVGGAGIIEADLTADNGVIHVLNAVMPTQP